MRQFKTKQAENNFLKLRGLSNNESKQIAHQSNIVTIYESGSAVYAKR